MVEFTEQQKEQQKKNREAIAEREKRLKRKAFWQPVEIEDLSGGKAWAGRTWIQVLDPETWSSYEEMEFQINVYNDGSISLWGSGEGSIYISPLQVKYIKNAISVAKNATRTHKAKR